MTASRARTLLATLVATSASLALATPFAQAEAHVRFFLSPSRNISCELDFGRPGVPNDAYCQTMSPPASATLSPSGHVKRCRGNGCIGNPPENDPTLAYGRSVVLGPFHCTSRAAGVTCLVGRHGFTISRAGVSSAP